MSDASPPVAVVSGASSGIGAATARALAAHGTTVVALARRAALLDPVVAACRRTAPESHAVVCDLLDLDAARGAVVDVVERFGRLDALVCVAGMPMRRRLEALSLDDVETVMRLNFTSPVAMTLAALPSMLARRRGTIVLVSSLVGRLGNGGEAAYCASKFALCGFAEAASVDLAGSGVDFATTGFAQALSGLQQAVGVLDSSFPPFSSSTATLRNLAGRLSGTTVELIGEIEEPEADASGPDDRPPVQLDEILMELLRLVESVVGTIPGVRQVLRIDTTVSSDLEDD